jgi:hypothetical protein
MVRILVWLRLDADRRPHFYRAAAGAALAHREPFLAIKPVDEVLARAARLPNAAAGTVDGIALSRFLREAWSPFVFSQELSLSRLSGRNISTCRNCGAA